MVSKTKELKTLIVQCCGIYIPVTPYPENIEREIWDIFFSGVLTAVLKTAIIFSAASTWNGDLGVSLKVRLGGMHLLPHSAILTANLSLNLKGRSWDFLDMNIF